MFSRKLISNSRTFLVKSRSACSASSKCCPRTACSTSKGTLFNADSSNCWLRFNHFAGLALAAAVPLAFLPVGMISTPANLAIGVLIPLHGHVGLNCVVTDYVPKSLRCGARIGVLLMTVVSIIGLTKYNLESDGLSSLVLRLWKRKNDKKSH